MKMYIKDLVKTLFKAWVVALALAMIYVGLSASFDKYSTNLSLGNLFVMTFAVTSGMWLVVFGMVVVKKTMRNNAWKKALAKKPEPVKAKQAKGRSVNTDDFFDDLRRHSPAYDFLPTNIWHGLDD